MYYSNIGIDGNGVNILLKDLRCASYVQKYQSTNFTFIYSMNALISCTYHWSIDESKLQLIVDPRGYIS